MENLTITRHIVSGDNGNLNQEETVEISMANLIITGKIKGKKEQRKQCLTYLVSLNE